MKNLLLGRYGTLFQRASGEEFLYWLFFERKREAFFNSRKLRRLDSLDGYLMSSWKSRECEQGFDIFTVRRLEERQGQSCGQQ